MPSTTPEPTTVPETTPASEATPTPPAVKTTEEKVLEWVIPINRSGLAIAAGYVALFNIPFFVTAPVALVLGILGFREARKKNLRGKGRSLFAIIYSVVALLIVTYVFLPK